MDIAKLLTSGVQRSKQGRVAVPIRYVEVRLIPETLIRRAGIYYGFNLMSIEITGVAMGGAGYAVTRVLILAKDER